MRTRQQLFHPKTRFILSARPASYIISRLDGVCVCISLQFAIVKIHKSCTAEIFRFAGFFFVVACAYYVGFEGNEITFLAGRVMINKNNAIASEATASALT